jgi:hypothetical protein
MKRRGRSALLAVVLGLAGASLVLVEPAIATPASPPTVSSRYISALTQSDLYDRGHSLGVRVKNNQPNLQDVIVILDFGGQTQDGSGTWGATRFGNGLANFASMSWIKGAVEQFGLGFFDGTNTDTSAQLHLGMGTNNAVRVGGPPGTQWVNAVVDVQTWFETHGETGFHISEQVTAYGANDIEPGFCVGDYYYNPSVTCPEASRAWTDAFDNGSGHRYYNFGSCDGCPTDSNPNPGMPDPWSRDDIWYVSYGAEPGLILPEIYAESGVNAEQWEHIAIWGHTSSNCDTCGLTMIFSGSLTQYDACSQRGGCNGTDNTATEGWDQLWDELNTGDAPSWLYQTPSHECDIRWD